MNQQQVDRMKGINELIKLIGDTDSRFFYDNGKYSHFVAGNKLFYIDKYTQEKVYPYQNSARRGFSEGGTLWALINDFREYIITGEDTNGNNGYNGLYATDWGYSLAGLDKIVDKAKEIGYIGENKLGYSYYLEKLMHDGYDWAIPKRLQEELKNYQK